MAKIYLFGLLVVLALTLAACQAATITSFEECVEAGNPIMESYPRQCQANGQTFVEDIPAQEATFTQCETQPEVCTLDYNPVCALVDNGVRCITEPCPSTDAVTFPNGCNACANTALGHYPGTCEEQLFVICEPTITGFSAEDFAEQNNGVCVDTCPGNYDAYVTQIGVQVCIAHYGEEEINEWPVCEASSDTCSCVRATETTDGQQIENAQFRCVPEQYGERLLFRSGMERLDETGQPATLIA